MISEGTLNIAHLQIQIKETEWFCVLLWVKRTEGFVVAPLIFKTDIYEFYVGIS